MPTNLPQLGAWLLVIAALLLVFQPNKRKIAIKLAVFGGFGIGNPAAGSLGTWLTGAGRAVGDKGSSWTEQFLGTGIYAVGFLVIYFVLKEMAKRGAASSSSLVSAAAGSRRPGSRAAGFAGGAGGRSGRGGGLREKLVNAVRALPVVILALLLGWGISVVPEVWPIANEVATAVLGVLGDVIGFLFGLLVDLLKWMLDGIRSWF